MIAHVVGRLTEKFIDSIIIDVNGVGYEVLVTALEYEELALQEEVKLYTYHHVREQVEELYGFSSLAGKRLFELLITVQGIGPKAALAILSLGDPEVVRSAIASSDSGFIQRASGVGKRTADRVVVDLADKVGLPSQAGHTPKQAGGDDALDALLALGYNVRQATEVLAELDTTLTVEEKVRQALKRM
ncbi:Holliday junction DNA helicase RuvA [candidate division TM7 genomosp. GTL1]|nr:Holliday junction DNA helicase RuvA [candidate division TM7 genomosp. GTL1]